MKNLRLCVALVLLCPAAASAQAITAVTSPASNTTIRVANDFATRAFQDPWDMNQKTDVGPFLGSNDSGNGWGTFTFTGGLFTGTTAAGDAQLWLLDTSNPFAEPLGKTGANFPIDASTYKVFAVRMIRPTGASQTQSQVLTWPNNIYESSPTTHFHTTAQFGGPGVYFLNLGASGNWTGTQRALRFQPTAVNGETVSVDWARLVPAGDSNSCKAIQWTGGLGPDGIADIYLDNDNNFSNGFYGVVQRFATSALLSVSTSASRGSAGCPVVSGAFNFHIGALPGGTYYAVVVPFNTTPTASNAKYSPGAWTIDDTPTLKFTSPSDEGSDDDFATSQMGDAWDMDKLADLDATFNITNPEITTLNMEAPDGSSLPNQRVFQATSVAQGACPSDGDPVLVPLDFSKRGTNFLINTDRYRLLTVEFGIPMRPRDLVCGSIGRVIWHKKGNAVNAFTVTNDIIFNHRSGVNLLDKVTLDLKTTCIEPASPGSCVTDWTNGAQGGVDHFRFDPHEFAAATPFYVKRIKLADFERAKTSYTIRWDYSEAAGTVDLYYDNDGSGFDGTPIQLNVNATAEQYTWSIPSNLPTAGGGTPYYIYAIFRDNAGAAGIENRVYAPLPVYMDANYTQRPRLVLSRRSLNFGVQGNTSTTSSPQTLRLTFVGPATTTPCWTIVSDNNSFQVTPSSGTGNATVTVSMVPQQFGGAGTGVGTFTVNEGASCPGTILNPGQQFTATFRISTIGAAPVGVIDTPADNQSGISGSLGITGWVVDDIDITSVRVYRLAQAGEPADGLGRVFIGNAVRVDDARPDVEAANPTAPFNYRGGWGYLLLTNFLPNLGNGTFVLQVYAADVDGHEAFLGQRTITVANSVSLDPFGAIDTPGQGETVSGTVNNFGWVLIRGGAADAHADPPHNGAVSAVIDGLIIGSPTGWVARSDLTALFPKAQFDGVDNALGVYTFNSAAYVDGVHTIAWLVVASNGRAAGIGSRYFNTVNGNVGNLTHTDSARNVFQAPPPGVNAFKNLGRPADAITAMDRSSVIRAGVVRPSVSIAPDATGLRTVFSRGLDRVVVDASAPGARSYEAYQVAGGTLKPLPLGASFDEQRGMLYWQPGVAFTGSYDFVVVRDGVRVPVRVVLTPESRRPAVSRLVRGLFTH